MSGEFTGKVTFDLSAAEHDIKMALQKEINQQIGNSLVRIKESVRELIKEALKESPEWVSLLTGKLRESFGIENSVGALNDIARAFVDSVHVDFDQGLNNLGRISINILRSDFREVLQTKGASYTYFAKQKYGKVGGEVEIPWLEWLLFKGDEIILHDVEINKQKTRAASRTGRAIMVHVGTSRFSTRSSQGWSVPSEFSGTSSDNWLTRVLEPLHNDIENIIVKELL